MPVHLRYRVPDVSIHLMLLFIMSDEEIKKQYTEFQYISCYSLSARRRLLMDVFCSFNTSHVTLYQITRYLKQLIKRFQYISCYSLSRYLVLVLLSWKRFNTSHVTLYRIARNTDYTNKKVSIHLMLLFIESREPQSSRLKVVSIHLMLLFI